MNLFGALGTIRMNMVLNAGINFPVGLPVLTGEFPGGSASFVMQVWEFSCLLYWSKLFLFLPFHEVLGPFGHFLDKIIPFQDVLDLFFFFFFFYLMSGR